MRGLRDEQHPLCSYAPEIFTQRLRPRLAHGEQMEESYKNRDGRKVRWAFERVATLDMLPEELSDGVEVYAELGADINDASVPFWKHFEPAKFPPGQSGVAPT